MEGGKEDGDGGQLYLFLYFMAQYSSSSSRSEGKNDISCGKAVIGRTGRLYNVAIGQQRP